MSTRRVITVVFWGWSIFWEMTLHAQTFSRQGVDSAIVKACRFLIKQQRASGEIRDSVNPLFNIWETLLAAEALLEANNKRLIPEVSAALAYLKTNENENGWICHNTKCSKFYCVETTAAYFTLLNKAGRQRPAALTALMRLQQADGAWQIANPDVRENKKFPSVTAFMLDVMPPASLKDSAYRKGVDFLEASQNAEGHWGVSWEYYNCPAYALWKAVPVLRQGKRHKALQKCLNYIYANQQDNGCWYYTDTLVTKQPSAALQTALMVLSLKNETVTLSDTVVKKAIAFLITAQREDGSWDGGYFPVPSARYVKKEYIFATSCALMALLDYRTHD
ncbi:MAG: prenyltransferase/squalene oxidase repeat-containing protein [Sediminibacterium sp.]|nr:prenyltransferase/squalene oxidase repeat-containing protein [Sediminibacterium sp.]